MPLNTNRFIRVSFVVTLINIVFFSNYLISKKKHSHHTHKKHHKTNSHHTKAINKMFEDLDKLFAKAKIRVSLPNPKVIYETDLKSFLNGTTNKQEIIEIIQKEQKNISQNALNIINNYEQISLYEFLRILANNKAISQQTRLDLMQKYKSMDHLELIKLFENGISLTSKFILIELKCGDSYGNLIESDDKINILIENALNNGLLNSSHTSDSDSDSESDNHSIHNEISEDNYLPLLRRLSHEELISELLNDSTVINQIRRHFLIFSLIGSATGFAPMAGGSMSVVNPINNFDAIATPRSLSGMLVSNYYFSDANASMSNNLFINPLGLTYSGAINFANGYGPSWWVSYTNGYLGVGGNFTYNLAQGSFWSQGVPTFISVGGMVYGWRDQIGIGLNLQTMMANGVGVGISGAVSLSRTHEVRYLGRHPIDGKIPSIRGKHKIEIDDLSGISAKAGLSVNGTPQNIPISVAFRAGLNHNHKKVYRTHVKIKEAQEMLDEADVPGILYILGKKIKASTIPSFHDPMKLKEGDELVEVNSGSLIGSFVVGLEGYVPISAFRVGSNIELIAEFELGLRRHPNNKFEVSIEPIRVIELSLFESMLNIFAAGQISRVAFAKKQVFMFDFNKENGKMAYYNLVNNGQLPFYKDITDIYSKDRGAEYLLSKFRAHNNDLRETGITRIYLEQINLETKKFFLGALAPIIPAALNIVSFVDRKIHHNDPKLRLDFTGYDKEYMIATSNSIATNGIVAVDKKTYATRDAISQGFSGRYSKEIFVTHKRIHTIKQNKNYDGINQWDFDSLIVDAQFSDTVITGNEENKMVYKINKLFNSFIDDFEIKNSKEPRSISIKREFNKGDLRALSNLSCLTSISKASAISKINEENIKNLIDNMHNKHADEQGLILKTFIEGYGMKGFAAIHALLGSDVEKLFINSQSGYMNAVLDAKSFIIQFSNPNENDEDDDYRIVSFTASKHKENEKTIINFYRQLRIHLRNIDNHLRLLHDDKYFIDKNSTISNIYGEEKIKKIIAIGARQNKTLLQEALVSTHKALLAMIDYKAQGFSKRDRLAILKMAKQKDLRILERAALIKEKFHGTISVESRKKDLIKRFHTVWELSDKINKRITALENDVVMQEMNPEYIKKYLKDLKKTKHDLEKLIDISKLSENERTEIREKFMHKYFLFNRFRRVKRDDFRIEGAFRNVQENEKPVLKRTKSSAINKNIESKTRRYRSFDHLTNDIVSDEHDQKREQIVRVNDFFNIGELNDYQ